MAATALVFVALITTALWSLFRIEHADTDARHRALGAARSIAHKIDAQFVSLEILLSGLSAKVSTNPIDVDANDALLRREKSELPKSIANILLLSPDGRNIGNAVGPHASAGDRDYFKRASAGDRLVVGPPLRSRSDLGWVIPVARPVSNSGGAIQAVLVVAIFADSVRQLIGANELPFGSLVRVAADNETEVAFLSNGSHGSRIRSQSDGQRTATIPTGGRKRVADFEWQAHTCNRIFENAASSLARFRRPATRGRFRADRRRTVAATHAILPAHRPTGWAQPRASAKPRDRDPSTAGWIAPGKVAASVPRMRRRGAPAQTFARPIRPPALRSVIRRGATRRQQAATATASSRAPMDGTARHPPWLSAAAAELQPTGA